jgi:hypothetical protein
MIESLELELRQLDGITFVAITERDGSVVIELFADGSVAQAPLRQEALRLAASHFDRPVVVEFTESTIAPSGPGRVKALVVLPWPERAEVEVHLAWGRQRVSVSAPTGDLAAIGRATIQALEMLGFEVPFEVAATRTLGLEVGGGSLVVLKATASGELRRGIAGGRSTEESAVRATLHALNRFLEPLILRAESAPSG